MEHTSKSEPVNNNKAIFKKNIIVWSVMTYGCESTWTLEKQESNRI